MSAPKLRRLLLVVAFCAGGEGVASAIDLFGNQEKAKIHQTAQPAKPASFQVGSAPIGAAPGPAPATLWRFMGIPQGVQKLRGATTNRRGNFPGREPTPPLKAIADPANLNPANGKAVSTAAAIKQKEDLAPQKIKALKYLAKVGCGCYPGVEEAFAEALTFGEECTEEVRYEAAKAMKKAAENNCEVCGKSCCCTAEMMQLLNDVATAKDDNGCFKEPSARVREAACEALMACRRRVRVYAAPAPIQEVAPPGERPLETIPPEPKPEEMVPESSTTQSEKGVPFQAADLLMDDILGKGGTAAQGVSTQKSITKHGDNDSAPASSYTLLHGSIVGVDLKTMTMDIEFQGRRRPTVGSQLSLNQDFAASTVYLGRIEVVYQAANGRVIAKPVGNLELTQIHKGDRVSGRIPHRAETSTPSTQLTQLDTTPPAPVKSSTQPRASAPSQPLNAKRTNAVPAKAASNRVRPGVVLLDE